MYCPSCGKTTDASVKFCPHCGAQINSGFEAGAGAAGAPAYPQRRLVRPRYPRMIAGVCSAFALQFGWDLTLVRVVTAALGVLTSGAVGVAYLIAWVLIPEAPYALPVTAAGYPPAYGPGASPVSGATTATPPPPPGSSAI